MNLPIKKIVLELTDIEIETLVSQVEQGRSYDAKQVRKKVKAAVVASQDFAKFEARIISAIADLYGVTLERLTDSEQHF